MGQGSRVVARARCCSFVTAVASPSAAACCLPVVRTTSSAKAAPRRARHFWGGARAEGGRAHHCMRSRCHTCDTRRSHLPASARRPACHTGCRRLRVPRRPCRASHDLGTYLLLRRKFLGTSTRTSEAQSRAVSFYSEYNFHISSRRRRAAAQSSSASPSAQSARCSSEPGVVR